MTRGGLRATLTGAVVTSTGALVLAILLLEDPLIEYRLGQLAKAEVDTTLEQAERALEAGEGADPIADRLSATSAVEVTVLDPNDRVIGDGTLDGDALGERQDPASSAAASLSAAARAAPGTRVERLGRAGDELGGAVALADGRVVLARRSLDGHAQVHASMRELLVVGGILAVVFAFVLTWALSRSVIAPAEELTRTADALATGDLTVRTRARRNDEFGELGRALDRMADQLDERLHTLRQEKARLRTVLESMQEAVFVTDARGRIALTNPALDRLTKVGPIGRTAMEAIRSPELHRAVRNARKGATTTVEFDATVRGQTRTLAAVVSPLPEEAGVVAVLHDVTELKRADRVRRDFVANASHELRTPLTAIRGFAETLKDGALAKPDSAERFVDVILRHTLRLQRLVDDLVALSRAESPEQRFDDEAVDVTAVIVEVIRGLEAEAQKRRQQLVLEGLDALPRVQGAERALDQVLVNLIDNAIKYSPEGGAVRVRAFAEPEWIVIEVENGGPGIPAGQLDRVFERFYRVDKGRARDVGGTGLGLAIVKHLVQRMGGEVSVRSEPDVRTVLSVRLRPHDFESAESRA